MYDRLLITFSVMVFGFVVLLFMKRRQTTLANQASHQLTSEQKIPTVVYFWSQACHVCKSTQGPIIDNVLAAYDKDQVVLNKYDIDESPDVAKKWGVMTLPTTILVDATGTIRHVNNGLVVAENLRKQLEPIIFQGQGR